ncbi:MAG: cation-translocating P-type ATPase [Firmicutes bacterium]|nr:cation-translocating P-type ATPase [Bacillota bacterium]
MQKINELLNSIPMTVVAGVFLAISLILILTDTSVPVDPAWVTVVICGLPLLYLAITRLIWEKRISSALLISIAMVAAIAIGELFAAGEVAFIMAVGAILEEKTVERAKKGLKKLISLAPVQGRRIIAGPAYTHEEIVAVEQIQANDLLRVLPGETIPVDGAIITGNTSVDQSIITGEFLPVDKEKGDDVFCGTINRFGSIDIIATKVGEDCSLQKLIRMVQEAENKKAPMERIADKWATWLVPVALAIAISTYIITGDIIRAVTVLVVFCPCALVLATPTSIVAAIGQATKHGVIIKSGQALEKMGKVDCIAFDKTGTLSHGNLVVSNVISFVPDITENKLLSLAASAESHSEHPLGKTVVAHAKALKVPTRTAGDFQMLPGKGIRATVENNTILGGNSTYLQENGVVLDHVVISALEKLRKQGKATILIAINNKCAGILALSDTLRPTAKDMVRKLGNMHTDVVLLTGDHAQTAAYFAEQAGIQNVHSELLPDAKVSRLQALQNEGRKICMIGDGVNDAPALKTADVGVAMGGIGSDITVEAADIVLIGDDIAKIPYLKKLSNSTISTIKFNISLSLAINFVAIWLSVIGVLNPVTGALVHNAGSVLVVLNSALLYDRKFD